MLLVDSYPLQNHDVFYTSADGCGIFVYISAGSPSRSLRQVVLFWFNWMPFSESYAVALTRYSEYFCFKVLYKHDFRTNERSHQISCPSWVRGVRICAANLSGVVSYKKMIWATLLLSVQSLINNFHFTAQNGIGAELACSKLTGIRYLISENTITKSSWAYSWCHNFNLFSNIPYHTRIGLSIDFL